MPHPRNIYSVLDLLGKKRAFKSSMQYKQIRIAQESLRKKQGAMRRAKMMKFKQYY